MTYQIEFTKGASKQLAKLPKDVQQILKIQIDELANEPRPNKVKKLEGDDSLYRI